MITVLNYILNLLANRFNLVAAIYSGLVIFVGYVLGTVNKMTSLVAQLDALVFPVISVTGLDVSPFSLMNYVLPLDVGMTLFAAWLVFHLTCTAIRFVKGFVPTVS
jgi:hypothetical protein